jgi:hypothetical protein
MEIFAAIALTFFFLLPGAVAILFWRQSKRQKQADLIKQQNTTNCK